MKFSFRYFNALNAKGSPTSSATSLRRSLHLIAWSGRRPTPRFVRSWKGCSMESPLFVLVQTRRVEKHERHWNLLVF